MSGPKALQILCWLALLGVSRVALAGDVSPSSSAAPDTVVVVAVANVTWNCSEATTERARWLADKASQDGAYQHAGECYLAAGQQALADEAFMKAAALASTDTSHKLSANADEVKTQLHQLAQAFRHR